MVGQSIFKTLKPQMAASLVFRRLKTLNIKQFTLWLGYKLQVFLGINNIFGEAEGNKNHAFRKLRILKETNKIDA